MLEEFDDNGLQGFESHKLEENDMGKKRVETFSEYSYYHPMLFLYL